MKSVMIGADFKRLIQNVTRFPSSGSFAGSELVNLVIEDGVAKATTFGVVLSQDTAPAKGSLPLVGIDERLLKPFVQLCSDSEKIQIEIENNEVFIRKKGREITAPYIQGANHPMPEIPGNHQFEITDDIAKKVTYLAEIAFSDSSRPELNAVMLVGDGRAVAVNQKAVAVLRYSHENIPKTALPIPLARAFDTGFTVHTGNETILTRDETIYSMPSPVKAQTSFPVQVVDTLEKLERSGIATFEGQKFIEVIGECNSVLGSIARTEVLLKFSVDEHKSILSSENGGAKFRASFPCTLIEPGEFVITLDEVVRAIPFLEKENQIKVSKGTKNSEVIFDFEDGWMLFPAWKAGKK